MTAPLRLKDDPDQGALTRALEEERASLASHDLAPMQARLEAAITAGATPALDPFDEGGGLFEAAQQAGGVGRLAGGPVASASTVALWPVAIALVVGLGGGVGAGVAWERARAASPEASGTAQVHAPLADQENPRADLVAGAAQAPAPSHALLAEGQGERGDPVGSPVAQRPAAVDEQAQAPRGQPLDLKRPRRVAAIPDDGQLDGKRPDDGQSGDGQSGDGQTDHKQTDQGPTETAAGDDARRAPGEAEVDDPAGASADDASAASGPSELERELAAYDQAEAALKSGQAEEAARRFEAFLQRYPRGTLELQAQMGLLNAYTRADEQAAAARLALRLLDREELSSRRVELRRVAAEALERLGRCWALRRALGAGDLARIRRLTPMCRL